MSCWKFNWVIKAFVIFLQQNSCHRVIGRKGKNVETLGVVWTNQSGSFHNSLLDGFKQVPCLLCPLDFILLPQHGGYVFYPLRKVWDKPLDKIYLTQKWMNIPFWPRYGQLLYCFNSNKIDIHTFSWNYVTKEFSLIECKFRLLRV